MVALGSRALLLHQGQRDAYARFMQVTKREHACLVIEKADARLVIDPGSYTLPVDDALGVVAVVITHEHGDHWTTEQIARILEKNPDARIFGPAGVATAVARADADFVVETVEHGVTIEVEPFTFEFFGSTHAVIHESIPVIDNVGVLVNGSVYYPGDSYTLPDRPVEVLAAPIGAPWLKVGDVMDFVIAVKPKSTIPVHEMVLSVIGKDLANRLVGMAAAQCGSEFTVLQPGESLSV